MKRILFFVLWTILVLGTQARAIEIYANGHKFDSLQEYRSWEKSVQKKQKNPSGAAQHKLYVLSVENGMIGALEGFYRTWGQPNLPIPKTITPGQLQEAIAQAVTRSKYPKLIISEPGKIRIMDMTIKGDK